MNARFFLKYGILPAYELLPANMAGDKASAMILAICLIETNFKVRRQVSSYWQGFPVYGPAKGYPQFEMSGGIFGVLKHEATSPLIRAVLKALNYDTEILVSYTAIEHNDVLAAAYARLLLWTLPDALPTHGQEVESYRQYLAAWRPGKPQPLERWIQCYAQAWDIVGVPRND